MQEIPKLAKISISNIGFVLNRNMQKIHIPTPRAVYHTDTHSGKREEQLGKEPVWNLDLSTDPSLRADQLQEKYMRKLKIWKVVYLKLLMPLTSWKTLGNSRVPMLQSKSRRGRGQRAG